MTLVRLRDALELAAHVGEVSGFNGFSDFSSGRVPTGMMTTRLTRRDMAYLRERYFATRGRGGGFVGMALAVMTRYETEAARRRRWLRGPDEQPRKRGRWPDNANGPAASAHMQ